MNSNVSFLHVVALLGGSLIAGAVVSDLVHPGSRGDALPSTRASTASPSSEVETLPQNDDR